MGWIVFLLIGLGAGVLSGLFGIGGGVVIVPALIFIARMQPQSATGTSLAALLLPVGALGAYGRHQAGARWTFEADARYGRSTRSGSIWDAAGAARWHASEKLALELGYGASVADLDIDGGAVRYSVQNLRIGMVLSR